MFCQVFDARLGKGLKTDARVRRRELLQRWTRDSTGRWLEFRPFRFHVITSGKLFTYMRPFHQAVYFGTGQGAVMPCGWVGNRRSSVALAMRHRRKCFIHRRAHGLDRKMSTPRTLSCGVWPTYLYVLSSHSATSRFTMHSVLIIFCHARSPLGFRSLACSRLCCVVIDC